MIKLLVEIKGERGEMKGTCLKPKSMMGLVVQKACSS